MADIREQMAAHAARLEGGDGGEAAPAEVVEQVEATPAAEAEPVEAAPAEAKPAAERTRDESGRFAKKDAKEAGEAGKAKAAPAPKPAPAAPAKLPNASGGEDGGKDPTAAVANPPPDAPKAPQAWKATVREHWGKLPVEVQQEVLRREKEAAQAIEQSAPGRKFHESFQQVVSPYLGMIQAEGSDPLRAVGNLLQTAAALRTAPPAHKAALVANIIRSFGVPVAELDAALSGQASPPGQQQHFDPNNFAQQIKQQILSDMQQQQAAALHQRTTQQVSEFTAGKEFIDELREDMAFAIQSASARGVAMTLDQAYTRAMAMAKADPDSEVGKVLRQREAAEAAKAAQASTQRARAAATSIKPQPAGANAPQPKGIREALAAAAAKLGR